MKNKRKVICEVLIFIGCIVAIIGFLRKKNVQKNNKYNVDIYKGHNFLTYEKYIKRILDIICSFLAIICFGWLYIIIAILVRINHGSPIIFKQLRPGLINSKTGKEKIFEIYKFRTMTNETDIEGNLLSDDKRITKFGKWLRSTSLDELPEVFNIIKGDMSVIGPRPQLVKDMVFMTKEQRRRHYVRPGLSGLAQIKGRNKISWDDKLKWDLEYIDKVCFIEDMKIVIQTVIKAFIKKEGITEKNMATAMDFGDYLLKIGKISLEEYNQNQAKAKELIEEYMNETK